MLMRAFVKFVRGRNGVRNLQDECHVVSSKSCNPIRLAELTNAPHLHSIKLPLSAPTSCADVMFEEDRIVLLPLFL